MTKHTLTPESITAAKALVCRLCENGHVRMSVPVDFARDEDMLICALIEAAEKSLATPTPAASRAATLPAEAFDGYLCRAHGESDSPIVELVRDLDGVRAFLIEMWLGSEDAADYHGTPTLPAVMAEIEAHPWDDEPPWSIDFEIGGISVEKISLTIPAALEAAQPASPAPLTDALKAIVAQSESIGRMLLEGKVRTSTDAQHQEWKRMQKTWDALMAQAVSALASPQVAPAPEPIAHLKACGGLHAWMSYRTCSPDDPNAIPVYEGAAPVQVAPTDDPALWVSPEQFAKHTDAEHPEGGRYLPCRKTPAGKFTQPLYAAPVAPQDDARDAIRREAFEQAAKEPRAYAEMLDKGGWVNRFPDELCAIFNASTNMAERIRALAAPKSPTPEAGHG